MTEPTQVPSYFAQLPKINRSLRLAGNLPANLSLVELVEGTLYVAREAWGKGLDPENPQHDIVRRGSFLTRNLDTTKRIGNDVNDPSEHCFAVHNDGIYSYLRGLTFATKWELDEKAKVSKDMRVMKRALTAAYFVRAKDKATQEAYEQALVPMRSTGPLKRNEHKKKAGELAVKAGSIKDSRGRVNPGRLEALLSTGIPHFDARFEEVGEILIACDRKEEATARYLDAKVNKTEQLHGRLQKFISFAKSGETLEDEKRLRQAANFRKEAACLREIDALPGRHALDHSARELEAAANALEGGDLSGTAVILEVTARAMEYQFVQQDAQELLMLTSLFEKEIVASTPGQISAFVSDVEELIERLPKGLDNGFKTPVVEDARGRLQHAIECVTENKGPHWDQVYDALIWTVQTT